jgi:hypothetical protein
MRILGFDVLYLNPVEDDALIRLGKEQGRTLLTRDTRLVQRRGVGEYLLIVSNDSMEQLQEVIRVYRPAPEKMLSRCIRCNVPLVPADKKQVQDNVPEYIYHRESAFGRCPACRRIFWQGTHSQHMAGTCRELIRKAI